MTKRNRSIIFAIVAIVALACACPTTGVPTENPPPATFAPINTVPPIFTDEPVPSLNVLLQDDFSSDANFESYSSDDGSAGVNNGVYVVRSTGDLWQWGRSTAQFSDSVIEVDVTMVAGPANNNAAFGIICRLAENSDGSINGYMLAISLDGYYTILAFENSSPMPLVDWTLTDAVRLGSEVNTLRATCNGSNLSLEVNGQLAGSATTISSGPTSGSIAFTATSFEVDSPLAEGHFDNLIISQP